MKRGLLAILCVILFGCEKSPDDIPYDKDKAEYKWGEWGSPQLISIADDSLAVFSVYKAYFKEWYECSWSGCSTLTEASDHHVGLFLVNYREKQKPIWGDTLEYNLTVVKDYFRDSSVLVFDRDHNKFGFWKIGTNAVEFIDYMDYSGKEYREYIYNNARPFTNGNIFIYKSSDKSKFLLEVENKQLKLLEFSGEYEWLSKCGNSRDKKCWVINDPPYKDYCYDYVNISYIGGELACIKGNEVNFELTVNNILTDTSSLSKSMYESIIGWYGNYIKDSSNKIHKIDTLNFKFDSTYTPIWLDNGYPIFCNDNQNRDDLLRYSVQDLFEISDGN